MACSPSRLNNIDAFTRCEGDGWTRCVLLHGQIVTMCCSHKLLNFAPDMKETSLFGLYRPVMFFAVWGRGWCNLWFLDGFRGKPKGFTNHLAWGSIPIVRHTHCPPTTFDQLLSNWWFGWGWDPHVPSTTRVKIQIQTINPNHDEGVT